MRRALGHLAARIADVLLQEPDDLPADLERLRGWNIRAAERELRRTHTKREAVRLVSVYKHRLGLTHGG